MRGPSRPVDPRYVPGRPTRRNRDMFGIGLIAATAALALFVVAYLLSRPPTASAPQEQGNPTAAPVVGAAATETTMAFATEAANAPRITAQEAIAMHQANSATFIDVRPKEQYATQRIKGAKNIPYTDVATRVAEFPRDGTVILYCQ